MAEVKEIKLVFVLFGATGDLAKRKLYVALYNLYIKGYLKEHFAVLGSSRQELTNPEFQKMVVDSLKEFASIEGDQALEFSKHFYYLSHDVTDKDAYEPVKAVIEELDQQYQTDGNRIFYMSVAPRFFGMIGQSIKTEGLMSANGFNRLMIEKPFGVDLQSATELQNQLEEGFKEDQIFRIDHYLSKEMVLNIAPLRFANPFIAAVWNKDYIKNVQVTLSETLGVEDRAGYYETAGALLDMIQNHTMQIVGWLAMEEPKSFSDKDIREAKNKAFNSLKIYSPEEVASHFVRGQYQGYLEEKDVAADSKNNTFVSAELQFDTESLKGVPFYIRSGKMLKAKATRVDVVFKAGTFDFGSQNAESVLSIDIDPIGKISWSINARNVADQFQIRTIDLDWQISDQDKQNVPEPYERMIHAAIDGDGTNFADWNGVETSWKFIDEVAESFNQDITKLELYPKNSMGPKSSDELLAKNNDFWIFNGELN